MSATDRHFVYRGRIKVSRQDMELLQAGRKKCTVRLGTASVATPEIYFSDGRSNVRVRILRIDTTRRLKDLTDQDARDEGFETRQQLLDDLKRFYPWAGPEQPITVIYFEPADQS